VFRYFVIPTLTSNAAVEPRGTAACCSSITAALEGSLGGEGDVVHVEEIGDVAGSIGDVEFEDHRVGEAEVGQRDLVAAPFAHRGYRAVFGGIGAGHHRDHAAVRDIVVRIKAGTVSLVGLGGLGAVLQVLVRPCVKGGATVREGIGLESTPLAGDVDGDVVRAAQRRTGGVLVVDARIPGIVPRPGEHTVVVDPKHGAGGVARTSAGDAHRGAAG